MATGLGARKDAHRANVNFDHPLRPTISYVHQEFPEEQTDVNQTPMENAEHEQQEFAGALSLPAEASDLACGRSDAAALGTVAEGGNAGDSKEGQKRRVRTKKNAEGDVRPVDAGKRKKEKIPTEQKSFHISTDILRRLTLLYAHNLSQGNTEKVTMSAIVNAALDAYLPKF